MRATFEEKTYESYFNSELARIADVYFPLGQVQEGVLGFDSSVFTKNGRLWRRVGYPFWFSPHFTGARLEEVAEEMNDFLGRQLDNLPQMKVNLLFQYKKPEYITMPKGKEWRYWNRSYYRYDIYSEQQELLSYIHNSFGEKILVIYASPAIHDVNVLVKTSKDRKIIDYSNFCKAIELNGHHRNTYIKAGTYSIACSEPERIENFDLIGELNRSNGDYSSTTSNRTFIKDFGKSISSAISRSSYYSESFNTLNERYFKLERYSLLYNHLIVNSFTTLTNTQWMVKLEP